MPPTFSAATPVGAVTSTLCNVSVMNRRSSVLLPVPAMPVRNTLPPPWACARKRLSCEIGAFISSCSSADQRLRFGGGRNLRFMVQCEADVPEAIRQVPCCAWYRGFALRGIWICAHARHAKGLVLGHRRRTDQNHELNQARCCRSRSAFKVVRVPFISCRCGTSRTW